MLSRIAFVSLLAGLLVPALPADEHESAMGANLLERIEINAQDIRFKAARLRSYLRIPDQHSWELHADSLSRISADIEDMRGLIKKFQDIKDEVTSQQGRAFNQILSASVKLADQVEKAIAVVNAEKGKLAVGHPDYEEHIDAIYNQSDRIAAFADTAESWYQMTHPEKND